MTFNTNNNTGKINLDLVKERQKCTFHPEELTYYIDGSKEATEGRRSREEYYLADPALKPSRIPIDYLSHKEKYEESVRISIVLLRRTKWVKKLYDKITGEMEEGQMERLPELHAMTCCLKAVSTADCSKGIETCRLSCGGHGYMSSSNLPKIYGCAVAGCTYEGENTVLFLQTARYLIRSYQNFLNGKKLTPTVSYLEKYKNKTTSQFQRHVEWIIQGFEKVAACKIENSYNNIQKRLKSGMAYEHAWNETSIELISAAEIHCRANVLTIYNEEVQRSKYKLSKELAIVMQNLLELYCVIVAMQFSGDLLRFTNTICKDINELQAWLEELLAAIRPNAIGIVDGFDMRDEVINSTLGSYDGNVYERLFAEAKKSPLNNEPVNKSFHEHLKPFLQSNM